MRQINILNLCHPEDSKLSPGQLTALQTLRQQKPYSDADEHCAATVPLMNQAAINN